jgi:hypothetical protein
MNLERFRGIFGNTEYLEALCVKRQGCNCNLDKDQGSECNVVAKNWHDFPNSYFLWSSGGSLQSGMTFQGILNCFLWKMRWTWSTRHGAPQGAVHGGPTTMASHRVHGSLALGHSGHREAAWIAWGRRGHSGVAHRWQKSAVELTLGARTRWEGGGKGCGSRQRSIWCSFYRPRRRDEGSGWLQSSAVEWTSKSIQAIGLRRGNGEPVVGVGRHYERKRPEAYTVAAPRARAGGSSYCFAYLEEGEGARLGRCWATRLRARWA